MDHKEFLAGLDLRVKMELTSKSDEAGLRHLAGHLGAICLLGLWIGLGGPLWWALIPVQGVLIIFLFTLEHEATHKTPFDNETLNEWVGRACGFMILLPFEWFRYFHLAHHRWTNIEGHDPELVGGKPETLRAWLWHVTGIPYWVAQGKLFWGLTQGTVTAPYLPESALPRIYREAELMAAGYALVAFTLLFSPFLLWAWLVPVLFGQPFLRAYLLAEHGDCERVENMFFNTRTTLTNAIVRFLAWNMPYHVEHHVFPQVPFHKLPRLHQEVQQHLKITNEGYIDFTKEYLGRRAW
ncbi:MAG: fatty acid desaturase [Paracoccaceae bacterium]